jgi:hypothetical protein
MWQKIKEFLLGLLKKLEAWVVNTVWPWFKQNWMEAVNIFVIWVAYVATKGLLHWFIGAWFLVMVLYFGVWKLLGVEKLFNPPVVINPPVPPVPTDKK